MEVVASAPGKVLIAGGYLVLERPNAGLVLSTTARFYAVVRPLRDSLPADSWTWAWTDVKVTSPQLSRVATYKLSLNKTTLQLTSSRQVAHPLLLHFRESTNPFVEQAIQFSVAAAKATIIDKERKDVVDKLLLQGLNITIIGHNDFYSYRKQIEARGLPLTPEVLLSLPPFSSITFNSEVANGTMTGEKCKPEVAKTGLGSSAAMTTSVVAALLHYLGAVNLSCSGQSSGDNASGRELDLVHAIAQSAHCLAQGKIGSGFDVSAAVYGSQRYVRFSPEILSSAQAIGGTVLPDVVSDVLTQRWDHENKQFSLPPLMTLWAEVATNQHQELIIRSLLAARDACLEIRLHMREMGIAAGVPIEPDSQTRLLDATMNMEGVLLAGVPGAGGFDAVFSVVLGDASNAVAHAWSSVGVLPLPVREDCRGVSLEDADPRTREVSAAVWSIQIN
ncbi:Phosphomevalonate kinase [Zea mays]|uniref:phosphomevalonate kinase n=1 Tax=Zea mays TaxID=4577 RepID=A0A1D6PEP6_MAIZE|nr:Phosphomevalonate kinase [Zea mays]